MSSDGVYIISENAWNTVIVETNLFCKDNRNTVSVHKIKNEFSLWFIIHNSEQDIIKVVDINEIYIMFNANFNIPSHFWDT
jgi:hypothetical protein